jgi:glycosyltransferase involved in cell wall biosynthesis
VTTVSVVVPAFNEESRLPRLLEVVDATGSEEFARAGLQLLEVIVVDDGSTDRTPEVLAETAETPWLRPVITRKPNVGKGSAVRRGVRRARGELVLICDTDLATPLREVAKLNRALAGGADVAIGSRALDPRLEREMPRYRRLAGRAFNLGMRILTGLPFRDTQCGFKLMPTAVAQTLLREQLVSGFAFDVEILMRARNAGLRIEEVPVVYVHDHDTRVAMASATAQMGRDVMKLAVRLRRPHRQRALRRDRGAAVEGSEEGR